MGKWVQEELLILTKTYPMPSTKYRETTCVAAINQDGRLRRLYPIPFRLLDGEAQFRRWEWISAAVTPAGKDGIQGIQGDNRPESHRIDFDSIVRSGRIIDTSHGWAERLRLIEPHILPSFSALEERRQKTGETLGFIKPFSLLGLDLTPVRELDWSDKDKENLQGEGLFDSDEVKRRLPLEKLQHDFHYRYECLVGENTIQQRHKIEDWEAGALYRNCRYKNSNNWEMKFREKLETEFANKDLILMMGTVHRFPDQWLIIGLVYPPKPAKASEDQFALDL